MVIPERMWYLHPKSMPVDLWIQVVVGILDSRGVWKFGSVQLALIKFKHRRLINTMFAFELI